jgi:5-methylcytosine-specific restriction endonuclease McrA
VADVTYRNTTIRDRHRNAIARGQPACGICGQPIDYDLPHLNPGSFVVDHIIPLDLGGPDTLANKQAAHRSCNRTKGKRTDGAGIVKRSRSLMRPSRGDDPSASGLVAPPA